MANSIISLATTSSRPAPLESTRPTTTTHTPPTQVSEQKTDHAHVSSVGSLVAQASAGSDVRTEKVAALQQAISSGNYHVPASAVAGKIVDSLLS